MIELDGSAGEGGGQILRSALTLSMITGQPFRMANIRANRPKPGLMRQHLVAVQAAAQLCGAQVEGAQAGARSLSFVPGPIKGGEYKFAIGTAGSCTLVLQTVVPALLFADSASTITVCGGTHNPMAPPAQFLQRAYGRVLAAMGAQVEFDLKRFGFYPAGGGEVVARVQPCAQLKPLNLRERGERTSAYAESFITGVPLNVTQRELACVGSGMGWEQDKLLVRGLPGEQGPGNALLITLEHEHVTEVFCAFGEKSVRAEAVARQAVQQARDYLRSGAAVGEYLADQIMLPIALAGGGEFSLSHVSGHAQTNADVIARFLPIDTAFNAAGEYCVCTMKRR